MKTLCIIALFITGALPISVGAEVNSGAATTNTVASHTPRHPNTSSARAAQPADNEDSGTITVDVWSSATSGEKPREDTTKLSPTFAVAGLTAASRMQNTERRMEQSIKRGFPLGEFWIRLDFDAIDDSLRLASLSVHNDADQQALQQLETETNRLRLWSDWLIQQNRELRLADYYISPSKLDNDEKFQSSVACTNSLLSMLASGTLQEENRFCR